MKKVRGLLVSAGVACLVASSAFACEQKIEAYAHPTLFGSSEQVTVSPDTQYIVGGKILKSKNKISVTGKENVVVQSFAKDVLATIKQNTDQKVWNPKMPILRSELAVVYAEGLGLTKAANTSYSDVSSGYWAKPWIDKATAEGVMIGYPGNTFKPDQPVTKAEVFATIAELINVPIDRSLAAPQFKGVEVKYIPQWAIPASKEVVASHLLDSVPAPANVINNEYLSKEQVAYLIGNLRQSFIYKAKHNVDNSALSKYTPTCMTVKLNERLSARVSNAGDKFTAKTTEVVTIAGQSFAAGSIVKGEVVEVSRPGLKNPGYIKVKFDEITCGDRCLKFPKCISEAQAECIKNPNVIARLFGLPFSAVGRTAGVVGRTAGTGVNVIGNRMEQFGDNWSNAFVDTLALQPKAGLKSAGTSFVTLGKGIYDTGKVIVSGAFGVLYEVTDEIKYVILPSASNNSSLNPGEELTIVF